MPFRAMLAALTLLALAPPVQAAPQDDLAYLENALLADNSPEDIRAQVAKRFTHFAAKHLGKQRVRIENRALFAENLPDTFLDPLVEAQRSGMRACLKNLPPEVIKGAADFGRMSEQMDKDLAEPIVISDDPAKTSLGSVAQLPKELEKLAKVMDEDRFGHFFQTIVRCGSLQRDVEARVRQLAQFPPGEDLSFVADALEVQGVAFFPNRIAKQDFLRELRATALH